MSTASPQARRPLRSSSIDAVRRGGTVAVAGMGADDDTIDFERLARLWQRGGLDLEALVSRCLPLEEIGEGFRAMQAGEVIRSLVVLD